MTTGLISQGSLRVSTRKDPNQAQPASKISPNTNLQVTHQTDAPKAVGETRPLDVDTASISLALRPHSRPSPKPETIIEKPRNDAPRARPTPGISCGVGGCLLLEPHPLPSKSERGTLAPKPGSMLAQAAEAAAKVETASHIPRKSENENRPTPSIREYSYREPERKVPGSLSFDGTKFVEKMNLAARENAELVGPVKAQEFRPSYELMAVENAAAELLEQGRQNGLAADAVEDYSLQEAVGFEIVKQLKKGGVQLQPEVHQYFDPFLELETESWDGKENTTSLVASGPREDLMIAHRLIEPNPPIISTGSQSIAAYNTSPDDLEVVGAAIQEMDALAPELVKNVEHIHMTNFLGGSVTRERPDATEPQTSKHGPTVSSTTTLGIVAGSQYIDSTTSMVIRKASTGTGNTTLQRLYPDGGTEGELEETEVKNTIYHEAAHLLDLAKGEDDKWASELDGSPFSQTGELKREDFVSDYAMTNTREDFASTVEFVVQLGARKEPDTLVGQPLKPKLLKKLLAATKITGANPALLKKIDGWDDFLNQFRKRKAKPGSS